MATSDEAVKEKVQFYCNMKLLTLYEGTYGWPGQAVDAGRDPNGETSFDDLNDKPASVPFELRFRDWKLGAVKLKLPPQLKKKGKAAKKKETVDQDLDLERIRSFIGYAIMKELGIRDLMYSEGTDEVCRKIDLSHNYLYTNLGGFSPVSWKSLNLKKLPDAYQIVPHPAVPFGQTFRSTTMYRSDY
ncbi:hypothetical protein BGZ61DRAFT_540100 [Ilyonectria robusta]|uniref:uncharacterized protein n=1 Tax=Ilyonectria robusta TaxID=1079257 RepID=UPI001E8DDCAF|nr:uncharacterized protein BGZ61DRAFT_540100 [Ilyonectria robusta]KAH8659528.1 hypothetical protein BGZ61DRAFT_540100 [Ilyonectria robusta]